MKDNLDFPGAIYLCQVLVWGQCWSHGISEEALFCSICSECVCAFPSLNTQVNSPVKPSELTVLCGRDFNYKFRFCNRHRAVEKHICCFEGTLEACVSWRSCPLHPYSWPIGFPGLTEVSTATSNVTRVHRNACVHSWHWRCMHPSCFLTIFFCQSLSNVLIFSKQALVPLIFLFFSLCFLFNWVWLFSFFAVPFSSPSR